MDLSSLSLDAGGLESRSTADEVVDTVREAIQRGALGDGDALSQAAIAEHFGISRAPVREAFAQLRAEGLIETRAHHVAVVRGFTLERLRELAEHRALLERRLVERATPRMTPALLDELDQLTESMCDITNRGDWLTEDVRFHELLTAQAGDATGFELVTLMRVRAERCVRTWGGRGTVFRPNEAEREHREIIEHVARRDGAGAGLAMMRHIRRRSACLLAHGREVSEGRLAPGRGD